MRPIYEKKADRKKQRAAMIRLGESWGVTIRETRPLSVIDGFMYRDYLLVALVEFKARDIRDIYRYSNIKLSAKKYLIGKRGAKRVNLKFYFMVEFLDNSLWIVDLTDSDLPIHKGDGRTTDTRDEWDIEDCVWIPMADFVRVEE